jgi:hypothetical protein
MKLTTTTKTILIIYLLVSFFNMDLTRKLQRRKKAKSLNHHKNRVKITKQEKLKAFFFGFVSSCLAKIIEGQETENPDNKTTKTQLISNVVSTCTPDFFNNYESAIKNSKKEKGRNEEALKLVFNDNDLNRILPVCEKEQSINKLDDNDFSTLNILTGWLVDVFKDNPFMKDYQEFKAKKQKIKQEVKNLSQEYKQKIKTIKSNLVNQQAIEIAERVDKSLDGFIIDDTICEVMDQFFEVDLFMHIEALIVGAIKGVVCGSETVATTYATIKLTKLFENILIKFGISMAQGVLVAAFPPALVGFVISFIWTNIKDLTSISKFLIFSRDDNDERSLYESLGSLAGNEVIGLVL